MPWLQWVNFPDRDRDIGGIHVRRADFVDADVTDVQHMSRFVRLEARFQRAQAGQVARLIMHADGGNAQYRRTERHHHAGVFVPSVLSTARVAADGKARFRVRLTVAGGDRFTFKARSRRGTEVALADTVETRRKLFCQVIRMATAPALGGLATFRDRFWDPANHLYVRIEDHAAGHTIADMVNFNDTDPAVEAQVKQNARAVYDNSKAPFAFVVIVVKKNCIPGRESRSVPAVVDASNKVTVALRRRLFQVADPAAVWFHGATWTPNGGGAAAAIPAASVRVLGPRQLELDLTGVAVTGAQGRIQYDVTVIDIEGMGLSLPTENLVTVASQEADGTPVAANTLINILVHEVGHKIGMVPGPQGDQDLVRQSSYYDGHGHSGPHCRHPAPLMNYDGPRAPNPAPTCTMFGDIRTNTSQFCPNCLPSVRKVDVSPWRKIGIRHQF